MIQDQEQCRCQDGEKVVEVVENHFTEINEADAKKIDPQVTLEGFIEEQLPPMDFGRIAAQAAKQIIVQKVREADRARQYEEYKDKVGQIINGQVKKGRVRQRNCRLRKS